MYDPLEDHDNHIDKIIRAAIDEGKFSHLAGEGKPLPREDENPFIHPDEWAANRILKSSGFALPWIEERKSIEEEIITARAGLNRAWRTRRDSPRGLERDARWENAMNAFREFVIEINKHILTYNLKVPAVNFHIESIKVEREIMQVEDSK